MPGAEKPHSQTKFKVASVQRRCPGGDILAVVIPVRVADALAKMCEAVLGDDNR